MGALLASSLTTTSSIAPLYLGIIGSGACFVGINPAYNESELEHVFRTSAVTTLFMQPDLLERALPAAARCGISRADILALTTGHDHQLTSDLLSWRTLTSYGHSDWISMNDDAQTRTTVATLLSTSGTTGLPKAAAISHHALVLQNVLLYDSAEKPYEVKRVICLPQFHAFAAPLAHIAPLRECHTMWIMKKYQRGLFLGKIVKGAITETALVPPIVSDLLANSCHVDEALKSLRYVWCAGARLSAEMQEKLCNLFANDAIFTQVWGMSEIGWITAFHYPERYVSGSVGRLLPNMEARIIDENGKDVTCDRKLGEIIIRGPSLMIGSLGNTDATKTTIDGGWLRTGDIGHCENGKWYIFDRVKEITKVRCWQVSPAELEACLLLYPGVLDAAVVGVELSSDKGEVPRAYIVPQPGYCQSLEPKTSRGTLKIALRDSSV